MPPVHEKTRGVNELCSTSLIRCSLHLFFSTSGVLYTLGRVPEFDLAQGMKTLTSKNALSNLSLQTPLAEISSRPSSKLNDVLKAKSSPDNRSKCGPTTTFEQTTVNISAVMSLTSPCQISGTPPVR